MLKGKLSFCFVSFTSQVARPILDPSTRYRCFHPADELNAMGYFATVESQKFFESPNFEYDVYIFHRPSCHYYSPHKFYSVINQLKRKGKLLIADYDDLIFGNENIAKNSSIVKNKTKSLDQAIHIFKDNLVGLLSFDYITASTTSLSEQVKYFHPTAKVMVLPNFIPSSLLDIYKEEEFYLKHRARGKIGYFAGTKSHDKDIISILEPLHRVLIENPDFSLMVVGPVSIPAALAGLPNVIANSVINYMRLPSLMQSCETVIAPLEIGLFNDCKSRVKFLEAALSGCRLIATPITDMKEISREKDTYIELAETKNDWYSLLSQNLDHKSLDIHRKNNFNFLINNQKINSLLAFIEDIL